MIEFLKNLSNICCKVCVIGVVVGCAFAFIPENFIKKIRLPVFKFEQNGLFYEKYLKINKWKNKLPQFSNIMSIGFKKDSIKSLSSDYLNMFHTETIRAELSHIFLMILSPVYFIGDKPLGIELFFAVGNLLGNIPFIMIQRYNRPRIKALIQKINFKNCREEK